MAEIALAPFAPLLRVSSSPMKNLSKTIHENERLNRLAHRVRIHMLEIFRAQEKTAAT